MQNILVIGATGNVGKHLLYELKNNKNIRIRAFTRSLESSERLKTEGYDCTIGNLDDSETIKKALRGISKVFLASSLTVMVV